MSSTQVYFCILPIMSAQASDTIPWDQLLTDIHKRQVLPIIGPALVIDGIVSDFSRKHLR